MPRYCRACNRPLDAEHHFIERPYGRRVYGCHVTLVYGDDMKRTHMATRVKELNNRYVHTDRLPEKVA